MRDEQTPVRPSSSEAPVLLDEPLVPDPDADRELGPGDGLVEALSDEEIHGARFLLTRRAVEPITGKGFEGLAVALDASFLPPPGARFSDAEIRLLLEAPDGAVFQDVAPVTDPDPRPVKVTVTRGGKVSLSLAEVAEAGVSAERTTELTYYTCRIRGLGAGSPRATWRLEEDEKAGKGVGETSRLMVTLQGEGPFTAEVLMRCQLIRPGAAGAYDRVRELIFGPRLGNDRRRTIEISAPPKKEKRGWFFFGG